MVLRAYELWFEFLKRSDLYKKCCDEGGAGELSDLYAKFGNIHAQGLRWEDWWETHEYLFTTTELPRFVVDEMVDGSEFDTWEEAGEEDLLAVLINLNEPKQTILDEVEKMVAERQLVLRRKENAEILKKDPNAKVTERFGRPKIDLSFHHYHGLSVFPTEDVLESLEHRLAVYDACTNGGRQPPTERDGWMEVADCLGITVTPSKKTQMDYGPPSPAEERNQRSEKVKRYFRQACEVIENVQKGRFPEHS